jgi:hypothetical protein
MYVPVIDVYVNAWQGAAYRADEDFNWGTVVHGSLYSQS